MKTRYLMLSAVWHHLGVSVDSQYLCSHGIDRDLVTSSSASPFSYANCIGRTVPAAGKRATRVRNIGHITQIANKLIHLAHNQSHILSHLQRFIQNMREMLALVWKIAKGLLKLISLSIMNII
ncbi:SIT4 phosphatase-associated family protein [Trifolium repens]|nr:SIT4 phosphatase-associated family protein [Trifolium repens]